MQAPFEIPVSRQSSGCGKSVLLRSWTLVAWLLIPAVLFPSAAFSYEEIVVTGDHWAQTELTSAVSVLPKEEIEALRKRTVVGLLQTLPGVLVETQGGPGGLSAVSIRGGESNFTLVLLDGVPINDPTNSRGGSFDFSNLSPDLVERIEVIRGAQSAVYGSDALAGVINIITRRAPAGHQQSVQVQVGEDSFHDVGFSAAGTHKLAQDDSGSAIHYVLELQDNESSREQRGSQRENSSANIRVGWSAPSGHAINASYRYLEGDRLSFPEQGGGALFSIQDALDQSRYKQRTSSLDWNLPLTASWETRLHASRFEFEEAFQSPGIAPFQEVPPNSTDAEFTRDLLRWINILKLTDQFTFNVGLDHRDEDGASIGYLEFFGQRLPTDFELERSTTGAFVAGTFRVLNSLMLQASIRYDDPQGFSSQTSSALGIKFDATEKLELFANWGEAYKLPSFFALGHGLVGNSELEPEEARNGDVGFAWSVSDNVQLQGSVFANSFRNLIDFDDATFRNVNRTEVESRGAEFQLRWQPSETVSLRAQATYTDLEVVDEQSELTGRPQWTAGLTGRWQHSSSVGTTLDYRYVGQQWAGSRHTGELVTQELDDYHRVDLVLHWQAYADWNVQLMVDNLLDENYVTAVGFPAPERALRIGLRYSHR